MDGFKLKIGSSEFDIDENTFNYIKDDILNANSIDRTIDFSILYNADPLRTLKFFNLKIKDTDDRDTTIFKTLKDYYEAEKAEAEAKRVFIFDIEQEIRPPIKKIFVDYRFFLRKKRITKKRYKNITQLIKFN